MNSKRAGKRLSKWYWWSLLLPAITGIAAAPLIVLWTGGESSVDATNGTSGALYSPYIVSGILGFALLAAAVLGFLKLTNFEPKLRHTAWLTFAWIAMAGSAAFLAAWTLAIASLAVHGLDTSSIQW